jgi:hypothetical protein
MVNEKMTPKNIRTLLARAEQLREKDKSLFRDDRDESTWITETEELDNFEKALIACGFHNPNEYPNEDDAPYCYWAQTYSGWPLLLLYDILTGQFQKDMDFWNAPK